MKALNARRTIAAGVVATTAALVLAACSSGSEPAPASSAAMSSAPATAEAAPSPSATPTGAAALACAAYFDLDLLNSSYAGGAVKDGDLTEDQVRTEFQTSLKELSAQAKAAAADGSADGKLAKNALRMKKIVKKLDDGQPLSALSKKQQVRFAKSSLRVQKACDRAGFPLPADNITARQAAGL